MSSPGVHFNTSQMLIRVENRMALALLDFNTDKLLLNKSYTHHLEDRDTFTVLMCVEGEGILKSEGPDLQIAKGETVLLPASLKFVNIITENCTLLDVTIP